MGIPLGVIGSVVAANAAPASGDPHWDNVVMLANFVNGPWNSGNVDITGKTTTAAAQFGGTYALASATPLSAEHGQYLNKSNAGAGEYIMTPTNRTDWVWPGQFTIEWWMYATNFNGSANGIICKFYTNGSNDIPFNIYYSGATNDMIFSIANGTATHTITGTFTRATLLNSWHHIAYTRDSSNITRAFLDGNMVVKSGAAQSGTTYDNGNTHPITVYGRGGASTSGWSGYLDDLRITKDVCRYGSDAGFDVPTGPFWYPGIDD